MKKLLFLTAIVSLLFVGCNNDNDNGYYNNGNNDPSDPLENVRLLPSRIEINWGGPELLAVTDFVYDELNRLVRITTTHHFWGTSSPPYITIDTIIYDANGNPIQFGDIHIRYNGNQIYIDTDRWGGIDTLIVDDNGRLEKILGRSLFNWERRIFTYNFDGSIAKIVDYAEYEYRYWWWECEYLGYYSEHRERRERTRTYEFEYTDMTAGSIWRYVNLPKWFVTYFLTIYLNDGISKPFFQAKGGLIPTKTHVTYTDSFFTDAFSWEIRNDLNRAGYVSRIWNYYISWRNSESMGRIIEIEYILAR